MRHSGTAESRELKVEDQNKAQQAQAVDSKKEHFVRQKTLQRFGFSLVTLTLYFSFALNWTDMGSGLRERLGDTHVTGSLAMFSLLIILFILLEFFFIRYARQQEISQGMTESNNDKSDKSKGG